MSHSGNVRKTKTNDRRVTIGRLAAPEAKPVSALMANVIRSLPYYNKRAKMEEIAKYTSSALLTMSRQDRHAVIVARVDGRPVGFCVSKYDDGLVWLSWYGVHPGFRCSGIGTALLRALSRTLRARRAHKIWCDTRTNNRVSQRVMKGCGFVRVAQLKDHWHHQDFYLWEWYPR